MKDYFSQHVTLSEEILQILNSLLLKEKKMSFESGDIETGFRISGRSLNSIYNS